MLPMQNFTYYKCYLHVYVTNTKCYQCVTIRKCTKQNVIDPIYWSNIPEEFKSEIKNNFFSFHTFKSWKIGIPLKSQNNFRDIFNLYKKTNFL